MTKEEKDKLKDEAERIFKEATAEPSRILEEAIDEAKEIWKKAAAEPYIIYTDRLKEIDEMDDD